MTSESCKSLHPGSIPGQASTFSLGEAPAEPAEDWNGTEPNGADRDSESRPVPELGSADVPAKPKRKYRAPPSAPGVYLLFLNKRLVYVGRSDNPAHRVRTHRNNGRRFDYAVIAPVPATDAGWVEVALIEALGPTQNRRGVEVETEIVLPAPPPPPAADPDVALIVQNVVFDMEKYALSREFKAAIASGDIPTFEAPIGPRSKKTFTHARRGDIVAWRDRKLSERRAGREAA